MTEENVKKPRLSLVIPVFNEKENIDDLMEAIKATLAHVEGGSEVLLVNDGSTDMTPEELDKAAEACPGARMIHFRRNFGQTAALAAGFQLAEGDVIVPLDADMQNDPADIPLLLAEIDKGFDVVSGWRKNRKDTFLTRTLPSKMANWLISTLSGVHLHDYGCTLKAYRREVIEGVSLYGEMHRFIPIYASWQGAKITEIPVHHHPRTKGVSKYGLGRTFKVILDLLTVLFLGNYLTRPLHVFGPPGLFMLLCSFGSGSWVLKRKFIDGQFAHRDPLLLLAVFLFLVGVQLISMGLLAEILVRIYFEVRKRPAYVLRKNKSS